MFEAASAFEGLGKASLKLDFETETQLKDFARRYIVDEGDETPDNDPEPEKAAKAIINNLYRRTTGDAYMKPHKGGVDGPGDVYIITDTRSKAKKELDEIKALQKYEVQKFNKEALKDIEEGDPLLFEQLKNDLDRQPASSKKIEYPEPEEVKIFNEIFEAQAPIYKSSNKKIIEPLIKTYLSPDIWESWRTLNRFDGGSIPAGYQMQKDIELIADAIINNKIYKDGYIPFSKVQDAYTSYYYDVKTPKQEIENLQFNIKDASNIKDLKLILKKIKRYIDKIKNFQNKFLNGDYFKKEGIILQNTLGLFSLGKTANDEIYNNLDLLEFGGMHPTYQQLPDYNQFFAPAENKNSFAGYGLDDTKTLIADICRKHYKECEAIAKHLKGDSLLQSCFNLWHWLHHNIKYEYDRDGREEVRSPLRVWQDRRRGVDCDCLSVFAWCVLKCMGYNPAFELVAFNNKKAFSHIFINCDGVVVDRVWFIFNQRPPFVTKREIYKVNLTNNLGDLF